MAIDSQSGPKPSLKSTFIRALHLGPKKEPPQPSPPASPRPQTTPPQQQQTPRPGPTRLVKKQKSKSNLSLSASKSNSKSQDPLPPVPSTSRYGAAASPSRPQSRDTSKQIRADGPLPELPTTLEAHRKKYAASHRRNLDAQRGETRVDDTTLLHSLAKQSSFSSLEDSYHHHHHYQDQGFSSAEADLSTGGGEQLSQRLPPALWTLIASYLSPLDAATLAYSSPTFLSLLGPEPFQVLNLPRHRVAKIRFLTKKYDLDRKLPGHLFCYPCARFHRRAIFTAASNSPSSMQSANGNGNKNGNANPRPTLAKEGLKPKGTPNLIYDPRDCKSPERNRALEVRLTPRLALPFALALLAVRGEWYGDPRFGLDIDGRGRGLESLARRWTEGCSSPTSTSSSTSGVEVLGRSWRHDLRFHLHYPSSSSSTSAPSPSAQNPSMAPRERPKPHLLLRHLSSHPLPPSLTLSGVPLPPSAIRLLLFEREDYTPYFSVCAHWRQSLLVSIIKCALSHVASSSSSSSTSSTQKKGRGPGQVVKSVIPRGVIGSTSSSSSKAGDIVGLCGFCKPMRRCTECASEFLVEVRLVEGRGGSGNGGKGGVPMTGFRLSLVVTRWTDLGTCDTDPSGVVDGVGEWSAVVGIEGSTLPSLSSSDAPSTHHRHHPSTTSPSHPPHPSTSGLTAPAPTSGVEVQALSSTPDSDSSEEEGPEDPETHRILSGFSSFAAIGNRSLAGWFEASRAADGVEAVVPGQRVLSLDPRTRAAHPGRRGGGRSRHEDGSGGGSLVGNRGGEGDENRGGGGDGEDGEEMEMEKEEWEDDGWGV